MWFAKWFGGGHDVDDSDPSEHPPHPASARPPKAPQLVDQPLPSKTHTAPKTGAAKGFDPYNSGGFDKNKAWSRINR